MEGCVVSKKKDSVTVAGEDELYCCCDDLEFLNLTFSVHDYFQVLCLSPKNMKKIEVGNVVLTKVGSVVYRNGFPHILGQVEKVSI